MAEAVAAAARPKRAAPLPMPPRLSPTAIGAFRDCPQLFLFRHLWKLPEPPSKILAKGILVHAALEKVFALPPAERAPRLHDTLRDVWREERRKPANAALFGSRDEERQWGLECLALLDSYLDYEDPGSPIGGEPLAIEAWLSADLIRPAAAAAAAAAGGAPAVRLVGKVDRLDRAAGPLGEGGGGGGDGVVIVDYKTGKPPPQKYSASVNERIRTSALFQLRCYALLLARGGGSAALGAPTPRRLRLLYLGGEGEGEGGGGGGDAGDAGVAAPKKSATAVEEELPPPSSAAYSEMLRATEAEVLATWDEIVQLVRNGDPRAFSHCNRAFCSCHDVRPLVFAAGGGVVGLAGRGGPALCLIVRTHPDWVEC